MVNFLVIALNNCTHLSKHLNGETAHSAASDGHCIRLISRHVQSKFSLIRSGSCAQAELKHGQFLPIAGSCCLVHIMYMPSREFSLFTKWDFLFLLLTISCKV